MPCFFLFLSFFFLITFSTNASFTYAYARRARDLLNLPKKYISLVAEPMRARIPFGDDPPLYSHVMIYRCLYSTRAELYPLSFARRFTDNASTRSTKRTIARSVRIERKIAYIINNIRHTCEAMNYHRRSMIINDKYACGFSSTSLLNMIYRAKFDRDTLSLGKYAKTQDYSSAPTRPSLEFSDRKIE